jgi:hypothetical protein
MRDTSRDIAEILNYLHLNASQQSGRQALARFVIEHGRQWEAAVCDPEFAGGRPLACHNNSQDMLQYDLRPEAPTGLVYVEGIASASFESAPFPTLHGWLIDPRGRVVDPTWRDSEHCTYFGIPFHSEYVLKTIRTCGPCPMIDNRINRWELVRNPDVAARAILDWTPPIARANLQS